MRLETLQSLGCFRERHERKTRANCRHCWPLHSVRYLPAVSDVDQVCLLTRVASESIFSITPNAHLANITANRLGCDHLRNFDVPHRVRVAQKVTHSFNNHRFLGGVCRSSACPHLAYRCRLTPSKQEHSRNHPNNTQVHIHPQTQLFRSFNESSNLRKQQHDETDRIQRHQIHHQRTRQHCWVKRRHNPSASQTWLDGYAGARNAHAEAAPEGGSLKP